MCSYANCDQFIQSFLDKKLQTQPGCTADETLEVVPLEKKSFLKSSLIACIVHVLAGKNCSRIVKDSRGLW